MGTSTFVAGVGMTPFNSPKKSASLASDPASDYFDLAVEAAVKALLDAGITYDDVDQGIGCYVFGDSTCAQRVFYGLGMTGIPIFNVNNYCSSGSTGLWLANQAIRSGAADCVLVIGFDKMYPGPLPQVFKDRTNPLSRILDLSKTHIPEADRGKPSPGWTPQLYANAQVEYLRKYPGAEKKDFAQITAINREHGTRNPYSQLSKAVSAEDVLSSPAVSGDLTRLQCCPSSVSLKIFQLCFFLVVTHSLKSDWSCGSCLGVRVVPSLAPVSQVVGDRDSWPSFIHRLPHALRHRQCD